MKHMTAVNTRGLREFSVEILEDRVCDKQDTKWSKKIISISQ